MRIWNFFFVHPLIGVKLVRLKYMRKAPGLVEPAIRKFVRVLELAILLVISFGTGIQHEAGDTLAGQDIGSHAAGVPGSHDQDVVLFDWHCYPWLIGSIGAQ